MIQGRAPPNSNDAKADQSQSDGHYSVRKHFIEMDLQPSEMSALRSVSSHTTLSLSSSFRNTEGKNLAPKIGTKVGNKNRTLLSMEKHKTGVTRPRKVHANTSPEVQTLSGSSSYSVSEGREFFKEFQGSDALQKSLLSVSSNLAKSKTLDKDVEKDVNVEGKLREINEKIKFTGTQEIRQKKSQFTPLIRPESEDGTEETQNVMLKKPATKKKLSSKLLLASLTPPGVEDMAKYNRMKINERKKAVLNKWKENELLRKSTG